MSNALPPSTEPESLLQFPCQFPIKVFGTNTTEFATTVMSIMRCHIPTLSEANVHLRPSAQGKYTSITITIEAESKAQLDAIYQDLTASKHVLMAL